MSGMTVAAISSRKIEAALGLRQQQTDFEVVGLHLRESFFSNGMASLNACACKRGFQPDNSAFLASSRTHRVCLRRQSMAVLISCARRSPHASVSQQIELPLRLLFFLVSSEIGALLPKILLKIPI